MVKLTEYLKTANIDDVPAVTFPVGKTILEIGKIDVKEIDKEFDGVLKKKQLLIYGDIAYWSCNKIMQGLKKAIERGASKVEVERVGTGTSTVYTVKPIGGI
jgi:hypothetical protein